MPPLPPPLPHPHPHPLTRRALLFVRNLIKRSLQMKDEQILSYCPCPAAILPQPQRTRLCCRVSSLVFFSFGRVYLCYCAVSSVRDSRVSILILLIFWILASCGSPILLTVRVPMPSAFVSLTLTAWCRTLPFPWHDLTFRVAPDLFIDLGGQKRKEKKDKKKWYFSPYNLR